MAYYMVTFEGRQYFCEELFLNIYKASKKDLLRANGKLVLDTMVYPMRALTDFKGFDIVKQDFDVQFAALAKAGKEDQKLTVPHLNSGDIFEYKGRQFMRLKDVGLAQKYRIQEQLALVKICGRGTYVALDMKRKGIENPVVITLG